MYCSLYQADIHPGAAQSAGAAAAATFITNSGFSASAATVKGNPVPTAWTLANGVLMPTLSLNTAGMTAAGSERATMVQPPAADALPDRYNPGSHRWATDREWKNAVWGR